jgi:uncharacterized membrane-anchored protein YhcB (DUF1043 family)
MRTGSSRDYQRKEYNMWKVVGGVVVGIFVGAAVFELMQRSYPGLVRKIEERARSAVDAFRDGYAVSGRSRDEG